MLETGTMFDRTKAEELDQADPLAFTRSRFALPDGVIYLDGNSLGAMPVSTAARVHDAVVNEWGTSLIKGWNIHGWTDLAETIGDSIAKLIGAAAGSVICGDNTSTNLFKLVTAAVRLNPNRRVILTEAHNFPTDLYVLEGIARVLGHEIRRVARAEIERCVDADTALVVLTQVDYRSGHRFDAASITEAVHQHGALMLWDLAHSAGAFEVELDAIDADFAIGCGYKYLNGGPGAPAFCYVNQRLHETTRPMLQGWLGHADPFAFLPNYEPAQGIARLTVGTPPVLSMTALAEGVATFDGVDLNELRTKSVALTDLFIELVEGRLESHGFTLATPRDSSIRGSQVSFSHANGYPVMQALIARGVIGDFRAPDIMRFGFTPLYVRFVDVYDAVEHLVQVMETNEWDQPQFHVRHAVT